MGCGALQCTGGVWFRKRDPSSCQGGYRSSCAGLVQTVPPQSVCGLPSPSRGFMWITASRAAGKGTALALGSLAVPTQIACGLGGWSSCSTAARGPVVSTLWLIPCGNSYIMPGRDWFRAAVGYRSNPQGSSMPRSVSGLASALWSPLRVFRSAMHCSVRCFCF